MFIVFALLKTIGVNVCVILLTDLVLGGIWFFYVITQAIKRYPHLLLMKEGKEQVRLVDTVYREMTPQLLNDVLLPLNLLVDLVFWLRELPDILMNTWYLLRNPESARRLKRRATYRRNHPKSLTTEEETHATPSR